jgi:NAD(P)-dependent dehydrogenase (short-subunit alcohol dehydrogenase family)
VRTATEKHGRLDIMFNNAGIGIVSPFLETTEETYSRTIGIDLDGAYRGVKAAGQVMVAQKSGAIVNTASVAGIRGSVDYRPTMPPSTARSVSPGPRR